MKDAHRIGKKNNTVGRLLTDEVEDFEGGEALVDLPHEALEEDHLGQTDGEAAQVAREGVQVVEVVQLHRVREVEGQRTQVRAPAAPITHIIIRLYAK